MRLNLKKVIGNIAFIAILLLLIGRFLTIVSDTTFPMSVVSSHSMRPSLFEGDIVPWIPCSIDEVKKGDIVVYKSSISWNDKRLIVHRVVDITNKNGKIFLLTKGDANNYTDQAGPHIPEPPINNEMLEGKLITIGRQPLKIPFAGYPWLWIENGFKELSKPIVWGKPQSEIHYSIFIPLAFSASLMVVGMILWAPENGKSLKEKLKEEIFGVERLSFKRLFTFIFIFYIILLVTSTSFSYDKIPASLGIDEKPPKAVVSFGFLQENKTSFPQKLNIVNPSLFPVKGFLFTSGNISSFLNYDENFVFSLKKGERLNGNMTAIIPKGAKPGIYGGNIYIYSSPYWTILPSSIIYTFYQWSPKGAIIALSFLSAFLMSLLTTFALIILSFIIDELLISRGYLSFLSMPLHVKLHSLYNASHAIFGKGIIKNKIKNAFAWLNGEMHWVEFGLKKPLVASFIALLFPLLFNLNGMIYVILLSSIITGIAAYALGCRWRGEIMFSALLTTTWLSSIFAIKTFSYIFQTNHSILVPFSSIVALSGIFLFLFVIVAIPACLFSWLPGYLIHLARERRDYMLLLKECDL